MTQKKKFDCLIFGITGGIACGKSTVTKTFVANNIPVVDADLIAREVVTPGSVGLVLLVKKFGKEILFNDGALDRRGLAEIVYEDQSKLNQLNEIMYPLIAKEAEVQFEKHRAAGAKIIGYDAALIIETLQADKFRPLIVVLCKPETQLKRLMDRNMLTQEEALRRIQAQMSSEQKASYADLIINTDGTIEDSVKQTLNAIEILKSWSP